MIFIVNIAKLTSKKKVMGKLIRISKQNHRLMARSKNPASSTDNKDGLIIMFTGVRYERHDNIDKNKDLLSKNNSKRG